MSARLNDYESLNSWLWGAVNELQKDKMELAIDVAMEQVEDDR